VVGIAPSIGTLWNQAQSAVANIPPGFSQQAAVFIAAGLALAVVSDYIIRNGSPSAGSYFNPAGDNKGPYAYLTRSGKAADNDNESASRASSQNSTNQNSPPQPGPRGAFRQAKRDTKVPVSQQPEKRPKVPMTESESGGGKTILGKDGKPVMTREYGYTTTDGKKVVIQDHRAGHEKGGQGPHYNVRPSENTRTGSVEGTQPHYPFKP
jgi:hypothetical protein